MSVGQTIKHKTQAFKGRVTERIGRTTRTRRLRREGKTDRVSGKPQAVRRQGQGRLQALTTNAPGDAHAGRTPPGMPERPISRQESTAMKQTSVRTESRKGQS